MAECGKEFNLTPEELQSMRPPMQTTIAETDNIKVNFEFYHYSKLSNFFGLVLCKVLHWQIQIWSCWSEWRNRYGKNSTNRKCSRFLWYYDSSYVRKVHFILHDEHDLWRIICCLPMYFRAELKTTWDTKAGLFQNFDV